MLLLLRLNPLSFLLNKCKDYLFGKARKLFVDGLKLYSQNSSSVKKRLAIITFSRDKNMLFGKDKCGYLQTEKGKIMQNLKPTSINGLTIKTIEERDNYKYLQIDKSI